MIKENSGKIYQFRLDCNQGYAYAQLIDFTDLSEFDGRLICVFNRFDDDNTDDSIDIDEILTSGIVYGPVPIHRYPNVKGKSAWKLIDQSEDLIIDEWPDFKERLGPLNENKNWNALDKWYRTRGSGLSAEVEYCQYEEVRNLEVPIVRDPSSVAAQVTMLRLIAKGDVVDQCYDLNEMGNMNLYIQVVNTYCSLEEATDLLEKL